VRVDKDGNLFVNLHPEVPTTTAVSSTTETIIITGSPPPPN
jgi:hypothetical protein